MTKAKAIIDAEGQKRKIIRRDKAEQEVKLKGEGEGEEKGLVLIINQNDTINDVKNSE